MPFTIIQLALVLVVIVSGIVVGRLAHNKGWQEGFAGGAKAMERMEQANRRSRELAEELKGANRHLAEARQKIDALNVQRLNLVREGQQQSAKLAAATVDRQQLHSFCFTLAKQAMHELWDRETAVLRSLGLNCFPHGERRLAQVLGLRLTDGGKPIGFDRKDAPACLRRFEDFGPEEIEEPEA